MLRLPFQTTLLFAPLAYAIHHSEGNLVFNFREWRLTYFPDNNPLGTEAVFVILTGITLIYVICFHVFRTRQTVWMMMILLMTSQVVNAIFHLDATLVLWDFSPGLITALIVYVPVYILMCQAALRENLTTPKQIWIGITARRETAL